MGREGAPPRSGGSAGIVLWMAFRHDLADPLLEQQYHALLSEEERLKQARFVQHADRQRYLLTRALVRTVLSRYLGIAPERLSFSKDVHGRPQVSNVQSKLVFSISHADDMVMLGVTDGGHLGIDIEVTPQPNVVREVSRSFAAEEQAALRAMPAALQGQGFIELWTLKEAYLKALGLGLTVPLNSFGFTFPSAASLALREPVSEMAHLSRRRSWQFWQFALTDRAVLAVCAGADVSAALPEMRTITPLVSEQRVAWRLIRRSP